jgi:hypothetical protein
MKHMIKWLKVCAFLLTIILIVHSIEITYDFLYHSAHNLRILENH